MFKDVILKQLKNDKGFSFIESILTTVVLSIGLWGSLAVIQNATAHSVNNDLRVMATQLANEKIETIIADKTFQGFDYIDENNYPTENLAGDFNGFTRTIAVDEVSAADLETSQSESGYKRVDVSVSWGNDNGQNILVSTIVTEY